MVYRGGEDQPAVDRQDLRHRLLVAIEAFEHPPEQVADDAPVGVLGTRG